MFTKDQKNAIDIKGCDLLVAAAAGSGKTAVLVERIVKLITDPIYHTNIDRLLVVTFTEQAAAEMKLRISKRLNEEYGKISLNPSSSPEMRNNIKLQLQLLNKANITTIHSFCNKLVKENYIMLDIDPKYKIGDQAELLVLKQEIMENLLEEWINKPDNESFLNLMQMYNSKILSQDLRELVFSIHSFILSGPWPKQRLEKFTKMYDFANINTLEETPWARLFGEKILSDLSGILFEMETICSLCLEDGGPDKYYLTFEDDVDVITNLVNSINAGFGSAYTEFNSFKFSRLPTIRDKDEFAEALKNRRDDVKKQIKKLSEYFKLPPSRELEKLKALQPVIEEIQRLVLAFYEQYQTEKAEKNLLDFNDLEQYALQALYSEESGEYTDAALEIRSRYDEILTDEYQDSNHIQELILNAIRNPQTRNRFMVGDIKQSIYRFRQANPEIFIDKYNRYQIIETPEKGGAQGKIILDKNFRSRENILKTINFFFYQLMTVDIGEIDYDQLSALNYGGDYPPYPVDDTVEVVIIDKDDSIETEQETDTEEEYEEEVLENAELEARYIAARIKDMVNGSFYVRDKNSETGYRQCEYKDIVILTSSVKAVSEAFIGEFNRQNIPLFINVADGFFRSIEVSTVMSMLQIIDNPKQDIHIATVLYSPIFNFTCDELVDIRRMKDNSSLYDCIIEFLSGDGSLKLKEKLKHFLSELSYFRKQSYYLSVSELLWLIYERTHFFIYAGAMPSGGIRQANLRFLIEKAVSYESSSFKGLFHFIKYIEKLKDTDIAEAKVLGMNENTVKMMTIHASKGLEFPVVILSMLGKKFNLKDLSKTFILDWEYGFAPKCVDLKYRTKSDNIARTALGHKYLKENLSELLRVLYVAFTRAKEKLILTGTVNSYEKDYSKWSRYTNHSETTLPLHYMIKARRFIDFIIPPIMRKSSALMDSDCKLTLNVVPVSQIRIKKLEEAETVHETENHLQTADEDREYSHMLNWTYPHPLNLPSKVSISEIKRLHYLSEASEQAPYIQELYDIKMPEFLKSNEGLSLGTAIHTVMERIDFNSKTKEDIIGLIDDLIAVNLLDKDIAERIPVNKILKFLNSDLAQRIRESGNIKRESPFVVGLSPYEVYMDESYRDYTQQILLHGIIDLYFEEEDGIILVDYKSDRAAPEKIIEKYRIQMEIYKKAIERSTGMKVNNIYLYLFAHDKAVCFSRG